MRATFHNAICRKKSGYRPETGDMAFLGCNRLQCAGSASILASEEILPHPNRVRTDEVVA